MESVFSFRGFSLRLCGCVVILALVNVARIPPVAAQVTSTVANVQSEHARHSGVTIPVANVSVNGSDTKEGESPSHRPELEGVEVAGLNMEEVREPLVFTIIMIVVAICKIGYHHSNFLSTKIPESCILILLGIVAGAVIYFSNASSSLPEFFEPHQFFLFLLPPIILEASFSLHDRTFGENLGSILLFAVLGTILSAAFLGLSLYGLANCGAMGYISDVSFIEIMVFASLIVAVDPVAVLAVFQEIGVNNVLYFLVFGESLLNDGVTVVLYKVFQTFNVMEEITPFDVFLGVVKFLVVCIAGLAIGILAGLATALLTKACKNVKVAQPMLIVTMAYLGFLLAEMFEFSGIISIIGCGLTQKQYAFQNISDNSSTAIKYFINVASTMCEMVIFLFLGDSVVSNDYDFHVGFTLWTVLLCLVYRFIIIFAITFFINRHDPQRVRKIGLDEQFIIAYGGLRGAVCFALVALLDPHTIGHHSMFMTTTLVVILFTTYVQGMTIKPLVYLFKISLEQEKGDSLYVEFQNAVTDHMMTGIGYIVGYQSRNKMMELVIQTNDKYLQPWLTLPDPKTTQFKELYEHLILKEHVRNLKLSGAKTMQNHPELPHVASDAILCSMDKPKSLVKRKKSETKVDMPLPDMPPSPKTGSVQTAQPNDVRENQNGDLEPTDEATTNGSVVTDSQTPNAKNLRRLLICHGDYCVAVSTRGIKIVEREDMKTGLHVKTVKNRRLQGRRSSELPSMSQSSRPANPWSSRHSLSKLSSTTPKSGLTTLEEIDLKPSRPLSEPADPKATPNLASGAISNGQINSKPPATIPKTSSLGDEDRTSPNPLMGLTTTDKDNPTSRRQSTELSTFEDGDSKLLETMTSSGISSPNGVDIDKKAINDDVESHDVTFHGSEVPTEEVHNEDETSEGNHDSSWF